MNMRRDGRDGSGAGGAHSRGPEHQHTDRHHTEHHHVTPVKVHDWLLGVEERVSEAAGGLARVKVIALLACVLGLEAADVATVGAVAVPLEQALHISNTQLGLLITVSTAIGAVATLPVGVLVDRTNRTHLLIAGIIIWAAAELAGAAAQSYPWLLFTRLALGAAVATASPAVASLVGDFFRVAERARIYGYVLAGELVGAGIGILISGDLAAISWRISFAWLALPSLAVAAVIWRRLPEPARGGQSRLAAGADTIAEGLHDPDTAEDGHADEDGGEHGEARGRSAGPGAGADANETGQGLVEREVAEQHIPPRTPLVLRADPTRRPLWWVVRYVLSIPTNRMLIIASALGYFYFQGLRTFAVEFLRGRYGLSQATATSLLVLIGIGAIVGVLITGRLADRLVARGRVPGRVLVAGIAFGVAAALFAAGLFTTGLAVGIALFFVAAAALGGANPPLDAARLDIMHSRLWGRAEAVRTALRASFEAVAPLLFGYVSGLLGGRGGGLGHPAGAQPHGANGLDHTLLLMLLTLLAGAVIMLIARRRYARDVATAIASEHATAGPPPDRDRAEHQAAPARRPGPPDPGRPELS